MLAFLASHMASTKTLVKRRNIDIRDLLATSVLLDGALALAALLRVALDPVRRLAVIAAFLQPELCHGANEWPVVAVDCASEAERVISAASHSRYNSEKRCRRRRCRALDGERAARRRAVLERLLVRYIVP